MATIEIDHVTKVFGNDVVAVDDVSLSIQDGEFLVLVGPSGCGKSTLLRMLAGLEEVTAGAIRIDGKDVTDLAPRHRDIAMVFQSYALYPHMTVRENLGYGLKVRRAHPFQGIAGAQLGPGRRRPAGLAHAGQVGAGAVAFRAAGLGGGARRRHVIPPLAHSRRRSPVGRRSQGVR